MKIQTQQIKKMSIFLRDDNEKAIEWKEKIEKWFKDNYPEVIIVPVPKDLQNCGLVPHVVIVLGGDGTIIEMAQKDNGCGVLIMGLNLGHVGFMASVREPKDFLDGLRKLMSGEYRVDDRMKIKAEIIRDGKKFAEIGAINEVVVQSLLGMVELKIEIDGHPLQYIRGSGAMVSTASGSTAYNLSAHGPIVMPDINCFIVSELFDHNIPTPSVVIKEDKTVTIKVENFRESGRFTLSKTGEAADVVVLADGTEAISLENGDEIVMKKSDDFVKFVEIEPNYFFNSLKEKFAFK
ncbi:MAG: putative inorganic polyphosphate/ATP-NAD kinase [Parcubacteria group bacterium GW2011_GWF2_38_76]|nr:MAG: putative inorganic polyphosphate/ATP-NAD kinase [Parcubacteria group bacterium GW2011_GWF2_38_76]HBM45376.1 hypothetical protein [Patescibacteria group bacterium]